MQDCRSYRGADICSDHEFVISKINLKLKRTGQDKKNEIGLKSLFCTDEKMNHTLS